MGAYTATVKKEIREQLANLYGLECWYCGVDLTNILIHIDHIKPVSNGGPDDITNKALSCWRCNMAKGTEGVDSLLDYFGRIKNNKGKSIIVKHQQQMIKQPKS